MKKILFALLSIAPIISCAPEELGPTIPVPEDQGAGSTIDAPGVRIIDVKTDGFTANWRKVVDALEYEYIFDENEPEVTKDTVLIFTGLAVDTEHILKIKANPRIESGRLASPYVSVNILTNEIATLDSPALTAGSTYSSISVISWSVVPLAESYKWELSDGQKGSTLKTFVTFAGLIEGREYTLKVCAIPSDEVSYNVSDWSEIKFVPEDDGSVQLLSSGFEASSDAISFNIFASSGQYYWYDVLPLYKYNKYENDEAYLAAMKADIDSQVAALVAKGTDEQDAYASVLKSGSTNVVEAAYASLSYSVALFGMDLHGNVTAPLSRKELRTTADLDSDGPEYRSAGDWFSQTVMLGTSDPSTQIYFKRVGTDVVSVKYLLYTTVKFIKAYGEDMTQDVVNQLITKCEESGSDATETAIEKINSTAGYTAGYTNRLPGTSYTIVALATNSAGKNILCVNSISTRSTKVDNNWISYTLTSKGTNSLKFKVKVIEGMDAVSGRYYYAPYSEITAAYSRGEYKKLLDEKGQDMTAEELSTVSSAGYALITLSGLESGTQYFLVSSLTNSLGDTTWRYCTSTTN